MNQLESLKLHSVVVADTGDFEQLLQYAPREATTNPTLVLQAVSTPQYHPILEKIVAQYKGDSLETLSDRVVVAFGSEILARVPGRVSTEVDARLSFDTKSTIKRAQSIISLYAKEGIDKERILIKIASTWEGIQAAKELEEMGIHTNLTLLFSLTQAIACANAKVTLISPFVGRIYDWYKKNAGKSWDEGNNSGANDPGVLSVKKIFDCYKQNGIETEIMGASFRNIGQIAALAGCDLLTISPKFLAELKDSDTPLEKAISSSKTVSDTALFAILDESTFRLSLNRDAMATEKLAEGIRAFESDAITLGEKIKGLL